MTASAPLALLDTNVVLDWLLFDDIAGREIGRAILTGALQWIATPRMREEHINVLGRPVVRRWHADPAAQSRVWDSNCRLVAETDMAELPFRPRCTDPDDQMFIDLAVVERAAWLFSRDKALLSLAPQLRGWGVRITTPRVWAQTRAAAEATAV